LKIKFFAILLILICQSSYSQVSLVPAEHQVYDWLHYQRILGNLDRYSYETLPLMRGQIMDQLVYLRDVDLSKTDADHLDYYLREFSVDSLRNTKNNTYTQGWDKGIKNNVIKKGKLLFSKQEPHLFAYSSEIGTGSVDFLAGTGFVASEGSRYIDQNLFGIRKRVEIDNIGIRMLGTIYDHIGFHLEVDNIAADTRNSLIYDPHYRETHDAAKGSETTLYAQGFTSFKYKALSFHIGNGNIKYGLEGDESLIFRKEGGNFDWMRVNLDTKYVQFTMMHGALQGPTTNIFLPEFDSVRSRVAPQRWIAMRRVQITPWKWIQASFTEVLTYSNRPMDISYLNPIYPLRVAEYNNGDRDNPIWFIDGWIRPIRGLELYSTLGIDDLLELGDIFKKTGKRSSEDAVINYQFGFHYALKWGIQFNGEYIHIDPYFYAHKFRFNSFDENGIILANDIGPNADQYHFSMRKWFPRRSWIELFTQRTRKGLNEIDENGELVRDVGGDIFDGQEPQNGDKVRFLDGDVHEWSSIGLKAHTEPFRGINFNIEYSVRNMTKGTRIGDNSFFSFTLEFNLIPGLRKLPYVRSVL
jgi:hypothetical protein